MKYLLPCSFACIAIGLYVAAISTEQYWLVLIGLAFQIAIFIPGWSTKTESRKHDVE